MSTGNGEVVSVKIIVNKEKHPPGKLADAEVIFGAGCGPMQRLRLLGFAIWERRSGEGRNVTFPARPYSTNGERRSYALLRTAEGDASATDAIKTCIVDAYDRIVDQA